MTAKLPFLTPPAAPKTRRIGTEASGIIEMAEYGGLLVGETSLVSELLASEQSTFVQGARIADAISKSEEISLTEAFNLVESSIRGIELEPKAEEIRIRHAAEIAQLAQLYTLSSTRNMAAMVTALIVIRLNQPQWTMADTASMHQALFKGIWKLAEDEQEAENQPTPPPPDEETLGKPLAGTGRSRKPIGDLSVGI